MPDGQPHSSSPAQSSQEQVQSSQEDDARWDHVAEQLDAFLAAWEKHQKGTASEPCLTDFVTQLPDDSHRILLGELIKTDLEHRWQYNCSPKKMENYVEQLPELGPMAELPVELIYEELQARMQSGDPVSEKELRQRFPQQADDLCNLLGGLAVPGNATCTYFAATSAGKGIGEDVRLVRQSFEMFSPGDRVDDFELLLLLGSGTFAQVFLARQLSMERLVALKISAQSGSEPQTLAQLDHGNIVRVFDLRDTADPPLRLLYMEVVPGGTLRDVLPLVRMADKKQRTGQLLLNAVDQQLGTRGVAPPENSSARDWLATASWPLAVCQLGAQLAEGLDYAHDKGVLHRDVKPANVLLTPEGVPKLADFNISFNGGRADEDPADTFGGSMAYMAPEQLEACHPVLEGSPQLVREASDIYAVGVLLWEQVCGRRPFDDGDKKNGTLALLQRMIDQRRHADWPALEKRLPADCPPSMRQVLVRSLQADKRARYQSAGELARDLRMCLQPRCWKLLQPRKDWFSNILLRWPVLFVILLSFLPNALAGWFNYKYNAIAIIDRETRELANHFDKVQMAINGIAFPLGVLIGAWVASRTMRLVKRDQSKDAQLGTQRVLLFGRFVTLLSMTLWLLSGLAFPVALDWGQSLANPTAFYTHFFVSLALCGLVAAAYPYFLLTAIAVRWYLPALVRNGVVAGPSWKDLQTVRRLNRLHLALTALVPFLAILLVGLVRAEQNWVPVVASLVGLLGFAAMFALERFIDRDLTALETIAVGQPGRKLI